MWSNSGAPFGVRAERREEAREEERERVFARENQRAGGLLRLLCAGREGREVHDGRHGTRGVLPLLLAQAHPSEHTGRRGAERALAQVTRLHVAATERQSCYV